MKWSKLLLITYTFHKKCALLHTFRSIGHRMEQMTIKTKTLNVVFSYKLTCIRTWRQVFVRLRLPGVVKQFVWFEIWSSTRFITPVHALRIRKSVLPIRGSGSVPKCHGSWTRFKRTMDDTKMADISLSPCTRMVVFEHFATVYRLLHWCAVSCPVIHCKKTTILCVV